MIDHDSFPCFMSLKLSGCFHKVFNNMAFYFFLLSPGSSSFPTYSIGIFSFFGPIASVLLHACFTPSTSVSVWSLILEGNFSWLCLKVMRTGWDRPLHTLLWTPCIFQCVSPHPIQVQQLFLHWPSRPFNESLLLTFGVLRFTKYLALTQFPPNTPWIFRYP